MWNPSWQKHVCVNSASRVAFVLLIISMVFDNGMLNSISSDVYSFKRLLKNKIYLGSVHMTGRLHIETVCLVAVFNMQVRSRLMYIQKLNLAVWTFNCVVACAPHLRKLQISAESRWGVSGCSITSKPTHSWQFREGMWTRSHQKYRENVKVKWVSFQHWVVKEKIYFGNSGQGLRLWLLLGPLCSNSLQAPGAQYSINGQLCLLWHLWWHTVGGDFFSYLQRRCCLLVYGSKRWKKRGGQERAGEGWGMNKNHAA